MTGRLHAAGVLLIASCLFTPWTGAAGAAIVSGVQSGTATSNVNGTVTVSIASVDLTRSFLIFQTRSNGDRPVNSMLRGRIASATTLEFVRLTNESTPATINIQWYVVSFTSGVRVQRGDVSVTAATLNVTISPVSAVSRAFVLWSKSSGASETAWNSTDPDLGELTTPSNLQFRVTTASTTQVISWQVVEFTAPNDINVQKGSITTMTGNTLSVTATLGSPVDVNRTFVLVGYRVASTATGSDVGRRMLRAQLTDSTTITIDRSIAGSPDNISEIVWQAVELRDGSTVQRGSAAFASGVSQQTVALGTTVDPSISVPFASVQPAAGQNMGRSSLSTNDIIGVGCVTLALSPTQLTLTRNNTAADADVGWFLVQFRRRRVALIQ